MIAILAARSGMSFDELLRYPDLTEELNDLYVKADADADFRERVRKLSG